VRYRRHGRIQVASAARAVVLAGGAVNSPQLLMLSGIGPADHLRAHGIDVLRDAPEVGRNLQDHLDACTLYQATQPITYDRLNDLAVAWRYYVSRTGPGTSNIAEAGGFARSSLAPDQRPDLQFHFVPAMLDDHGRKQLAGHGFTVHACGLRPKSRGHVELASPRAQDKPRIHANYLSDPEGFDLKVMVEGVRWSRRLLGARAFAPYRGAELFPGVDIQDDAALAAFIRRKAETIYHPVGTCRMGRDPGAVVDPELRVHGIEGLRVVDASVMPTLIGGNTNAPVVMIAERASELLLAS
jgi:choline dehydrogenase